MAVKRQLIGEPETYRGHKIEVRHMGPDLLGYVDGEEIPNFFETAEATRRACRRFIDDKYRETQS